MSTAIPPVKEVDFMVLKEDWSRYLLDDGTELRVRVVVRKILEMGMGDFGYPNFSIESLNAVSALVPDRMKRPPSTSFNAKTDKKTEVGARRNEEKWQEYQTTSGYKILVKPTVVKVFKYEKYNSLGEPIYYASIQSIINVEKLNKNTSDPLK